MPKNPESPVKNWQLEAVQKQQDIQDKLVQRMDSKLEEILGVVRTLPTTQQLESRIATVKVELQEYTRGEIEKQNLKYEPIVSNSRWLLRLLVGSTITLMGSVVLLLIQVFSK